MTYEQPAPAPSKNYVYVLVRSDISLEQQLVQASHAALEVGFRFPAPGQTSHLVALSVRGEKELLDAAQRLSEYGIEHHVFFEPDNCMGHSALASQPIFCNALRRRFKRYPLLRMGAPI
jgi:hypothetical protein